MIEKYQYTLIEQSAYYRIVGNFRGRKFSRLSLHDTFRKLNFEDLLLYIGLYTIIRFQGINFRGCSEILENSEIYCPRKIPAIWYTLFKR